MKKNVVLLVILLGIVLPSLLFNSDGTENVIEQKTEVKNIESVTKFPIKVLDEDRIRIMELEDYITGVVLGEMPASFEMEALKAQSVATRTYTLRKILKQGKHIDADVCTDASCCQAFVSKEDYLSSKGTKSDMERIEAAVWNTESEVITYNGELIEATYFSCSGGMTEDAVAVWGTEVPYLESVVSPGEDQSKHFETQKIFTIKEFLTALGLDPSKQLKRENIVFTYTNGNGIETMTLFGSTYTGTQLRQLLNLPSTAFSLEIDGDQISIVSNGYGHRVGMSQYGADAMALSGSNYDEILLHYYKGTSICRLTEAQLKALFDKAGNI